MASATSLAASLGRFGNRFYTTKWFQTFCPRTSILLLDFLREYQYVLKLFGQHISMKIAMFSAHYLKAKLQQDVLAASQATRDIF
jgi:hypothetical protein